MKTNRKGLVAVLSTIGIFAAVALLALALRSHRAQAQTPGIPAQADQIGKWIDDQTNAYATHLAEEDTYTAKAQQARSDKDKAHLATNGYRIALCSQFHLLRQDGKFVETQDCPDFR